MVDPSALAVAPTVANQSTRLPCSELMPWGRDDRIWWAMTCGLERRAGHDAGQSTSRLLERLGAYPPADQARAARAFATALVDGVHAGFSRYLDETSKLIRTTLLALSDLYGATYHRQLYIDALDVLRAPPDSAAYLDGLDKVRKSLRVRHPELTDVLGLVAVVTVAMRTFSEWLAAEDHPLMEILAVAAEHIGAMIGAEIDEANRAVPSPDAFGKFAGDLLGQVIAQVIVLLWAPV